MSQAARGRFCDYLARRLNELGVVGVGRLGLREALDEATETWDVGHRRFDGEEGPFYIRAGDPHARENPK